MSWACWIGLWTCLFLPTGMSVYGQNLVKNHSFTQIDTCGNPWSQIGDATDWFKMDGGGGGTPDHFHPCSSTIPNNAWGSQNEMTSDSGYAYVGTYIDGLADSREYFYGTLQNSLKPGKEYCVTYYISLADDYMYATDGIEIYFSENPIVHGSNQNIQVTPHVSPGIVITDTSNWIKVRQRYSPTGLMWHMTLGNFKDDSQTPTQLVNSGAANTASGYYLDNISIKEIRPLNVLDDTIYACSAGAIIGDTQEDINSTYHWSPVPGLSDSTSYQVLAKPQITTTYTITKTMECDTSTEQITVIVDSVYCSYKGGFEDFELYPNPSTGSLTLSYTMGWTDDNRLIIHNDIGQVVYETKLDGGENVTQEIDLPSLRAGLYVVSVLVNNQKVYREKLVLIR